MRLSLVVSVLFLCGAMPSALVRTFSTFYDECEQQGMKCVYPHDCPTDSRPTSNPMQCQENKICCWSDGQQNYESIAHHNYEHEPAENEVRSNHIQISQKPQSLYLKQETEENDKLRDLPEETKYSDYQKGPENRLDTNLFHFGLFNGPLDRTIASSIKATSIDANEGDKFVFPDTNEEPMNDRINIIKKLYQKFAIDLKRNYSNKSNENLPKRKLKYIVGYKSIKNCKMYEKYTASDSHSTFAIPLLPSLFPFIMQVNHCSRPLPLIVGGTNATRGEFPHMAGLGYDRGDWIDFLCGGSLISERYVLTAAHCGRTKWGPPIVVRLGTQNLITDVGQNMDVEDVIIHPDYKEPSSYNDIALLKIAPGLQMGNNVRPACLPPPDTRAGNPGKYLTASGWGRTGYGWFPSPNLQKVSLKVIDSKTCDQMFLRGRRSERLPKGIYSTMLCAAGYIDSSQDTCQGDSGGPLQTLADNGKCIYEIVGITSFGKLCGTGIPAIYTRVSTFIPWIEDLVWPS